MHLTTELLYKAPTYHKGHSSYFIPPIGSNKSCKTAFVTEFIANILK